MLNAKVNQMQQELTELQQKVYAHERAQRIRNAVKGNFPGIAIYNRRRTYAGNQPYVKFEGMELSKSSYYRVKSFIEENFYGTNVQKTYSPWTGTSVIVDL